MCPSSFVCISLIMLARCPLASCRGSVGHISYVSKLRVMIDAAGSLCRRAGTVQIPALSSLNMSSSSGFFFPPVLIPLLSSSSFRSFILRLSSGLTPPAFQASPASVNCCLSAIVRWLLRYVHAISSNMVLLAVQPTQG